ncbi:MAG: TIGR03663 family protein [Dehalococcoidia bacterium]|nr:TIGR03663 family protein [Dehalococcoidia bacterium]MDP7239932.1 TIGR03663 family protein [Dehalococcoidia bacterium]
MKSRVLLSTGIRNWYAALFLLLLLLAGGMRLWQLDLRPYHYDESLHAFYSWELATGEGYQHDPKTHGPFQFEATAGVFKLAGDSDYTARLPAAVVGSLLVAVPYFLRRELGKWGALAAGGLLAFSPIFLYLSRFARADIYLALWILLLVSAMVGYTREQKNGYLYLAAAALGLAFATKEVAYMLVVIFLAFLLILGARELGRSIRDGFRFASLSPLPSLFLFILSLSLPLFAPGIGLFQGLLGVTLANADNSAGMDGEPLGMGVYVATVLLTLSVIAGFWIGTRWRPRQWLLGFAVMYGLYVPMYTTFFTNLNGLATGVWGSVGYWLVQHGKGRLEQPFFYYPLLLTTYEFLALLLAMGAAVYYVRSRLFKEGSFPITGFLLFWTVGAFLLFSYAGEKAPWLLLHLVLPLALLGGKFVGQWAQWRLLPRVISLVFLSGLAALSLPVALQASYTTDDDPVQTLVYAQGSFELKDHRTDVVGWLERGGQVWADADVAWPWAWYLRNYDGFRYTYLTDYPPPDGVLVIALEAQEAELRRGLPDYAPSEGYRNLLWFPEQYRGWDPRAFLTGEPWQWWAGYVLFRESVPYWDSAGVIIWPSIP